MAATAIARISGAVGAAAGRDPFTLQGLAGDLAGAVTDAVLFDVGAALDSTLTDLQEALEATSTGLSSCRTHLGSATGGTGRGRHPRVDDP